MRPTQLPIYGQLKDLNHSFYKFSLNCEKKTTKELFDYYISKEQLKKEDEEDYYKGQEDKNNQVKFKYYNYNILNENDLKLNAENKDLEPRPHNIWLHLSCARLLECYKYKKQDYGNRIYIDGF